MRHLFTVNGSSFLYNNADNHLLKIDARSDWLPRALASNGRFRAEYKLLASNGFLARQRFILDTDVFKHISDYFRHNRNRLTIFTTNRCNSDCKYCYQRQHVETSRDLTPELVEGAVNLLFRSSRNSYHVNFFGGEPFLAFDMLKYTVAEMKERADRSGKKVSFSVTTNGILLNGEIADFVVANDISVMLSLDGDAERSKFRYSPDRHSEVMANARRLLQKQIEANRRPLILRPTLTTETQPFMEDIYGYIKNELPRARIGIGSSLGFVYEKTAFDIVNRDIDIAANREELQKLHQTAREFICGSRELSYRQLYLLWSVRDIMKLLKTNTPMQFVPKICGVCRNMLAMGPEGDFYPCHRYYGMSRYVMGNVQTGWDIQALYRYYRDLIFSRIRSCEECWVNSICPGQCPWYLSKPDGLIESSEPNECDSIRRIYEYLLACAFKLLQTLNASEMRRLFQYVARLH